MMPFTRQDIEILLDTPDQTDFVVSAYADMTVKEGFDRHVEQHLKNQVRAAEDVLAEAKARKALEANLEVIRSAVMAPEHASAKGLAIFSSVARQLRQVVPLEFPVENLLVVDAEPFVLPLLERWYGEPVYLVALVDSDEAHLFESHVGVVQPVRDLERPDVDDEIQRDKPRFTYKKRFAQTRHERLHHPEEDKFLQDVAGSVDEHWRSGRFTGLILLGEVQALAAMRRLLPKDIQSAVVDEAAQAMTTRPEEVADDVARAMQRWHDEHESRLMAELRERWKEKHLVANGPTDVLDALQQGRTSQIVFGSRRADLMGARCTGCGYRFGAPIELCVYCQGRCRKINVTQEILRMALRHRVPVHLFRKNLTADPLAEAGGVAALLVAEANWAPDLATAQASEGH